MRHFAFWPFRDAFAGSGTRILGRIARRDLGAILNR